MREAGELNLEFDWQVDSSKLISKEKRHEAIGLVGGDRFGRSADRAGAEFDDRSYIVAVADGS
jgi:hypothetical protein